jgi:hypothetical protein
LFTTKENGDPKTAVEKNSLTKSFTSIKKIFELFFLSIAKFLEVYKKKIKVKKIFFQQ